MTDTVAPVLPDEDTPKPEAACVQLTSDEVERIWSLPGHILSNAQAEQREALRRWLNRYTDSSLAGYLTGKTVKVLDPQQIVELTADTLYKFRPQVKGVAALQLLGKVIDAGNEMGIFSLCPPPVPVILPRQASPFATERWPNLDVASRLRELLSESLRAPKLLNRARMPPMQIARFAVGQLMVSTIVHGGLAHADSLEALVVRLLEDRSVLDCLGSRVFVELSLNWRNQADAEFRRWFPDDLSAVLMMNLQPDTVRTAFQMRDQNDGPSRRMTIRACIQTFLRHTKRKNEQPPRSLSALLDATRLDLETRVPIMLVRYASRGFVSHSVKPDTWRRLHGAPPITATPDRPPDRISPPGTGLSTDVRDTDEIEPRWLRLMREALRGDDRQAMALRIDQLLDGKATGFQPGSPGHVFAGYARRLLLICNDNKVRMSVRTACAYVISTAKRLGGLLGTADLREWGGDEWTALYEEALSDAENELGRRRKLARALREFQRYLEQDHAAEPIDEAEVFGSANWLVPVDANIISHDKFLRIRDQFAKEAAKAIHPDLSSIAWLMLTLAYRCGLRRMEALKLELADVLIEAPAELLIRPTEARRLKTKSATRKLPLHALLDDEEMANLKAWVEHRRKAEKSQPYSRFLFALPQRNFPFVPQDTLFKLLHRVMRTVTGDPTLRFHHLRHTFASRCQFTLALDTAVNPVQLITSLPGSGLTPDQARNYRKQLYGNTRMTRRDIWAVSALLGHSGPDVSLQHYIHFLDLTLADHLRQPGIAPDNATVIAASGKSTPQAYRYLNPSGLSDWVVHLWRRHPGQLDHQARSAAVTAGNSVAAAKEDDPKQADSIDRIWRLLFLHETRQMSLTDLAEKRGVEIKRLQRFVTNAQWLHGMPLSATGTAYRHRFKKWAPDKRHPDQTKRILCPIKPHEHRDRALMEMLIPQIRDAIKRDKALTARVFDYFAHHARPNFAGLIFTDPADNQPALDFLAWLDMLGIKKSDLRLISYDVTTTRSKWPGVWRKALGLPRSQNIEKRAPPNGRKDWSCPWLGIEPVFLDETGTYTGAAAFRFCIVMAIIASPRL